MSDRTITTTGTGQREGTPELATVKVIATGDGDTADMARTLAKDHASTIRESLPDISAEHIRTVELQVQDTDEMFDPASEASFQARQKFLVDCVPATVEMVVTNVTEAGGTVQSVQFYLHEEVHQQLENEALAAAMERAREKAERIATTEGLAVGEVHEVTTDQESTGMESIVDEALAGYPETDVHPGSITISKGVEVVYTLTEE